MSTAVAPPSHLHVESAFERLQTEARHGVADLSRYRCRYVVWGDGPPLVLMHGLGDRLDSFTLMMASLSQCFRCIAYDQPIGGEDGAHLKTCSHDLLVKDLNELLDHLDIASVPLLGHSYGSTVMFKALADRPRRFPRGISLCGFGHRVLSLGERLLSWFATCLPGRMTHLPFRSKALHSGHHWSFADLEPERWQRFLNVTGTIPIAAMGFWALQLHRTNVVPLLSGIAQPILLIAGDNDTLVRGHHPELLLGKLPNAAMFEISRCGHFPLWTHEGITACKVREFLGACQ
jgi:pimeloyl-ACP methyl ester carboxylesterase